MLLSLLRGILRKLLCHTPLDEERQYCGGRAHITVIQMSKYPQEMSRAGHLALQLEDTQNGSWKLLSH